MSNSDNMSGKIGMSERDMLQHIMEELRSMRVRLDDYIDDRHTRELNLKQEIAQIREDLAGHKAKVGAWSALIAVVLTGFVNWVFGRLS